MKNLFFFIGMLGLLIGCNINAYAKITNNCDIIIRNSGSYFTNVDVNFFAVFYYDSVRSKKVTGSVSSYDKSKNEDLKAQVVNSTCDGNTITLNWDEPNFKGSLTGYVNVRNLRLENMIGHINSIPVKITLIAIG